MLWIVFEGPDGVGKTTIIEKVATALREQGYRVYTTAEPTESKIGNLIRTWLLKEKVEPPHVYALLFTADRYLHVYGDVLEKLQRGYIVLQERYIESTIVYQSAMGLDCRWLEELNRYLPQPDLTIVLDVDPEELVNRISKRYKQREIFEIKEFLKKVRELYLIRSKLRNYILIDASDIEKTYTLILDIILKNIRNRVPQQAH